MFVLIEFVFVLSFHCFIEVRIEDIVVPPGLSEHCPVESINKIYKSQGLRPLVFIIFIAFYHDF